MDLPAALWPSADEFGIPLLRLDMQASGLVPPFRRWGRETRKSRFKGTFHYFTADERFSRLWSRPQDLLASGCAAVVEPNYSLSAESPRALAVWRTYQKRWLSRSWAEFGVKIIVDLFVPREHAETNLLGVPTPGWRAYATRGSSRTVDDLVEEAERAEAHAGGPINLTVYGGARPIRELCAQRAWLWQPEEADAVRGRHGA